MTIAGAVLSQPSAVGGGKAACLRSLLHSGSLQFLLEAHNGISAKIAEEAGFAALWASGLSMSAQFGVRDNNEASWTQVLEMLEFMADATRVPILLDGDTGYGNFNNVRRLVRKLEQRQVAGVCLEDKLFPKTNSFLGGGDQSLADIDEFAGKIKAAKDAQADDAFVVVARVEAFIAGRGLAEAMRRAEAYQAAGADAILIHSALSVPDEVLSFKREWGARLPVVIVPTKYYRTPTEVFQSFGFAAVIWANHLLRTSIGAMQATARRLCEEQHLLSLEDGIAPLSEVFRLQGAAELEEAEERYLPRSVRSLSALVLAASRGSELGELTEQKPKAMIDIGGKPLLAHIAGAYRAAGIGNITVVRGYKAESVTVGEVRYADNVFHETTGELVSLATGLASLEQDSSLIVSYGDVLFRKFIPEALADVEDSLAIAVDSNWRSSANRHRQADYVRCSLSCNERQSYFRSVYLQEMADEFSADAIDGEWMGFLKIAEGLLDEVRHVLAELLADNRHQFAKMPVLINELVRRGYPIRVLYMNGHWLDVDSLDDVVAAAGAFR